MTPSTTNAVSSEPVEAKHSRPGRLRVTPRQLSPIMRQLIVDRFDACHSSEEIAEELRVPARTVTDVVLAGMIRRLMEPARAYSQFGLRRTA